MYYDSEEHISSFVQQLNRIKFDYNFRKELKARRDKVNAYSNNLQSRNYYNNAKLMDEENRITLLDSMRAVYGKKRILFCVDVEAYERNHDMITEIGISIYDPRADYCATNFKRTKIQKIHIIIQEHEGYYNGRYVKDNKENFLGGPSLVMSLNSARQLLEALVSHYFPENVKATSSSRFGVSLVGHSIQNDLVWLDKLGVYFPDYVFNRKYMLLDTSDLWKASFGDKYGSLGKLLTFMAIPNAFLHNGGNDSFFTILLLMVLCDPGIRESMLLDRINSSHLPDAAFVQLRKKGYNVFRSFTKNDYLDNVRFNYRLQNNEAEFNTWTDFQNHHINKSDYQFFLNDYADNNIISQNNIAANTYTNNVKDAIEFIFCDFVTHNDYDND